MNTVVAAFIAAERTGRRARALEIDPHYVDVAVKRWQKALKRQETGSVAAADVIYAAGPLRAARQSARLGAAAAADVLMVTTTRRIVTRRVRPVTTRPR